MRLPQGFAAIAALALALACGPTIVPADDAGSTSGRPPTTGTSTPPGTTSPGTTAPGTTPTPDDGSTAEVGSEVTFVTEYDVHSLYECDQFGRDCPPGYKCVPWANDGGNAWNSTRCVPIADDPDALGEPCMVEGSGTSGIDTCEAGSICWDVDPRTNEGTCRAQCVGDERAPYCEDPGSVCLFTNGPLYLCLPTCNPLVQDCPAGQGCYNLFFDTFTCTDDLSGDMGVTGDPCELQAECDPGHICVLAEYVPGCGDSSCCTSFCQTDDPMPPCVMGQTCEPYFAPGDAPPGYELLGICAML